MPTEPAEEEEVTSDTEDSDWDPFEHFAAFNQHFETETEVVQSTEPKQLRLHVRSLTRKGRFGENPSPTELLGEWDCAALPEASSLGQVQSLDTLRLRLPFAAGGCNQGTAGLKWVTLERSKKSEDEA
mmetsp:Transcript_32663/g.72676  ORF Transcript_32663/g.72676 Transcript_32663/m.72676 type:complete len:128 (+) Transcript_32663:53-436(+)